MASIIWCSAGVDEQARVRFLIAADEVRLQAAIQEAQEAGLRDVTAVLATSIIWILQTASIHHDQDQIHLLSEQDSSHLKNPPASTLVTG